MEIILDGEKTIEDRFSSTRSPPFFQYFHN
jgi:hypothetical protein